MYALPPFLIRAHRYREPSYAARESSPWPAILHHACPALKCSDPLPSFHLPIRPSKQHEFPTSVPNQTKRQRRSSSTGGATFQRVKRNSSILPPCPPFLHFLDPLPQPTRPSSLGLPRKRARRQTLHLPLCKVVHRSRHSLASSTAPQFTTCLYPTHSPRIRTR